MGAGAQGQRQSEGSQRRYRAAARSQAVRRAGAEYRACRRAFRSPGNRLTFDDLDSIIAGSRLRGRLALTLGEEKNIEGEVGLDQLALAPAFALAIGAAGRDAAEPLGAGLVKGWRGNVAFQALRGLLPGGSELQPVSGTVKSDGQSLTFDAIKGKIGGGEVTATIDARPGANGIALNASVQFSGVDGAALRYRNLAMPAGRASMQMTLTSQGRSASALTGALSGSGTVTLESARIAGLDPRAFEVAIRASDSGQATDDARLKQIVEPVLVGRRVVDRLGANSVQHQGRPDSRRRDHARRQWRPRHRFRRIRYSRRPGRHPRHARLDVGGHRGRPSRKFSCLRWARPMRSIAPLM